MTNPLRLCLVLHNHQPVGNFDGVFEQAYQDSYAPFLDLFDSYPADLRLSLHTSGPLMEWLDERHPDYIDRLARLVASGRLEIVGGAHYEPILTMIPSRDRVGQIQSYTAWLENRLGAHVQGMWMPERVWEQSLTSDLAAAGIKYTVLDDFHFKNAGLSDDELHGYYLTEDDGRVLAVFPGSEPLRYYIPFQDPQQSIDHLRGIADRFPNAVVVFGDDGEKFGTWPETKKHVYEDGWLRRFFDALLANRQWLKLTTLAEASENVPPVGKIYLPDGSYREMTEWALPVAQQIEYDAVVHELAHDPRWPRLKRFLRGGFWRNFNVMYPEANEMYSRMMLASKRLAQALADGGDVEILRHARTTLYRGQCNCPYWHGAFGGIYLPHLRNAVYNQLIACDNLVDQASGRSGGFVEAAVEDYNFDLRQEVRLASDKMICLLAPAAGGQLYELDVRTICLNLLATFTRRREAYHQKVLAGANQHNSSVASIHDRVVFKQEGLDQRVIYDQFPRKSLLDHFFDPGVTHAQVASNQAEERGDFVSGVYDAKIRRAADRIQVQLSRTGRIQTRSPSEGGAPAECRDIKITKAVTLIQRSPALEVVYLLENLSPDETLHFAVEFNLAGLPSGLDDRYFHDLAGNRQGHLGTHLDLADVQSLGLVDEWLGIDVQLTASRPTNIWTFPIETVSQSEGGFELVHQSVAVLPHWQVRGDASGRWTVTMTLTANTALAESRMQPARPEAVAAGA
jgi:alpha-amylase